MRPSLSYVAKVCSISADDIKGVVKTVDSRSKINAELNETH